jgi:serine/threonine protein kinase
VSLGVLSTLRTDIGLPSPVFYPFKDLKPSQACPHCKNSVDVSHHNPLVQVPCPHCAQSFVVAGQIGGYQLLHAYDLGWSHCVYLAENKNRGQVVILKVLPSHALPLPNALKEFYQQILEVYKKCTLDKVAYTLSGQQDGLAFFGVVLKPEVPPDHALETLGLMPETIPPLPDLAENRIERVERSAPCPFCQQKVHLELFDVLDMITCPSCNREFELLRQFGTYQIESYLGSGGTSRIFIANNPAAQGPVALKIIKAKELQKDPSLMNQFKKEAELTQPLVHPNIIRVYEGGVIHGFPYLALEYVKGLTLTDIFDKAQDLEAAATSKKKEVGARFVMNQEQYRRSLPELICLEIVLQAAQGLGHAHSRGLLHGDVKPDNLMITEDGLIKVLDFGLCQPANVEKLFRPGEPRAIYGTPLYIPPERVRGDKENFTSDFYSLGATLYHMLRGIEPFRASTVEELIVMHANQPLVSFKAYAPFVSDTTCRIVEKSLKKSLEGRYQSHVEFVADVTLAKSLLVQNMNQKPKDGQTILKQFVASFSTPDEQEEVKNPKLLNKLLRGTRIMGDFLKGRSE